MYKPHLRQNLEQSISQIKSNLTTLSLTRQGAQSELTDLIRARTELECTIADLRFAAERTGGRRSELEMELGNVQAQIVTKEAALAALLPEWEAHRAHEIEEKRRLDEAKARLDALYAKRGRLNRFRTRAERDTFLRREIASIEVYRGAQSAALEGLRAELEAAKGALLEIDERTEAVQERVEDGRRRAKELGEQVSRLKDEHADLSERRKELWREDAKLDNLVTHAADELRASERTLASMMDKVSPQSARWIRAHRVDTRTRAVDFVLWIESRRGIIWTVYMVLCIAFSKSQTTNSTLQSS